MESGQYDATLKVLVLGETSVGKSCLILRFADGVFQTSFISTIGIDFKTKTLDIDGKRVRLQIWDTAGQERFRAITAAHYRGSNAALIVYDVTDKESFSAVEKWHKEIIEHAGKDTPVVLVGNKIDMGIDRQVPTADGEELAEKLGTQFLESSAKTGESVQQMFVDATQSAMGTTDVPAQTTETVHLKAEDAKQRKADCRC